MKLKIRKTSDRILMLHDLLVIKQVTPMVMDVASQYLEHIDAYIDHIRSNDFVVISDMVSCDGVDFNASTAPMILRPTDLTDLTNTSWLILNEIPGAGDDRYIMNGQIVTGKFIRRDSLSPYAQSRLLSY